MSHVTYIKNKGVEHKILTEQYEVGLYCLDAEEIEFHKELRSKYEYNKDKSSVL